MTDREPKRLNRKFSLTMNHRGSIFLSFVRDDGKEHSQRIGDRFIMDAVADHVRPLVKEMMEEKDDK